jgi:hypothetical protein
MVKKRKPAGRKSHEVTASEAVGFFTGLLHKFLTGVLSVDRDDHWLDHLKRLGFGALGGVFYAAIKNYTTEGAGIVKLLMMEPGTRRSEMLFGYWVAPMMSAVIGAVIAWLSNLRSRRLLFLMGVMGTFIVTSLFPGLPSSSQHVGRLMDNLLPVSAASAANETQCVGDTAFIKGFKAFFGVRDHYDRYAVVVASGKNIDDAEAKLKKLKAEHPELNLRVGPRACDNNFYPVFASDYLPLKDAKTVLSQVRKLDVSIADAYLSPGPRDSDNN